MPRNMMDAQEAANYLHISYWTLLNRAKKRTSSLRQGRPPGAF